MLPFWLHFWSIFGLLSTFEPNFVEVRCREVAFVHGRGHFCGCCREIAAACSRTGCLAWKFGAGRGFLSTGGGIFVDAEGKCCRLSTYRVPSVEVRCPEVFFVHAGGAQRGSSVPGGGFCPRTGAFLWMRRGDVAACPRTGCPAWMQGAQGVTFWCRRALRFRLFSVFKISNSKKRKMWGCREENFTQNVVREGVCC